MTVQEIVPSYLYQEYSDDEDLQAFIDAYNEKAQQYLDWFNAVELPVYTKQTGSLLDWVAAGLYGFVRPVLPFGVTKAIGPYNSWAFNTYKFNSFFTASSFFSGGIGEFIIGITPIGGYYIPGGGPNAFVSSDDTFKRVITWHFDKGDGRRFNIRWLKRRVMQFLNGVDGIPINVDQTYRVSISFGVGNQVVIRLINGITTILNSSMFNNFGFNNASFNTLATSFSPLPPFPEAAILQAAINAGVLELPFQFDYVVQI